MTAFAKTINWIVLMLVAMLAALIYSFSVNRGITWWMLIGPALAAIPHLAALLAYRQDGYLVIKVLAVLLNAPAFVFYVFLEYISLMKAEYPALPLMIIALFCGTSSLLNIYSLCVQLGSKRTSVAEMA